MWCDNFLMLDVRCHAEKGQKIEFEGLLSIPHPQPNQGKLPFTDNRVDGRRNRPVEFVVTGTLSPKLEVIKS